MPNPLIKCFWVTVVLLGSCIFSQTKAQEWSPDLSISMEDFKSRALEPKEEVWVVDFWASWCRPCIMSIPHLKDLNAKYQDRHVRFLSLSWDEEASAWQRAMEHFKLEWNMLHIDQLDAGTVAWIEEKFPHQGIPTAFVISREGKLKKVSDVYDLEKFINKAVGK